MWHEARRQEKQLRARIVDGSKRAERRRRYFDNVRRDPDQFMQIHGNKSVIYAERSIARAAEDANILRPWVGDKEILIDRFDARSHLDCIETPEGEPQLSSMEKKEELVCNYERYRLLVMNEFKDISEKAVLKNISEKEFWLNGQTEDQRKVELEKKKRKTGEKKATIGFSYGDSTTVAGRNEQESESEDEMQTEELGADLEVYLLNPESQKRCNKIGENFGVADQNFCALFKADQQAQRTASELKRIDRQKASLIGRDAKDDRKLLKQERAILIANARQDESIIVFPSERATEEKAVSESSSSSSDEESAKAEFILSFGKDDEEPLKKLSSRRRKNDRNRRRSRSRSRSRDRRRSATGSRERYRRRRSYSRDTRSKSRERRRSRDRGKRSRDKKRSVRSRSRSTDRKRRRARTSSSRSQSPDRPIFKNNPVEKPKFQEVLAEKRESSDDNGPTNLLDIRSSMSESEKERIEIENRKRRVRKTKRMLKSKPGSRREHTSEKDNSEHVQAVKKKMQKALKATVEELKEEEEERKRETERERRVRDELIFIEQQERKMREQKKVEDLRRADLERAIEDARKRAEVQRRRRHSSDSDDGD